MKTLMVFTVFTLVALGSVGLSTDALSDGVRTPVVLEPNFGSGPLLQQPPQLEPQEMEALQEALDRLWERRAQQFRLSADPMARPEAVIPGSPSSAVLIPPEVIAPGDFTVYRNTLMTDVFTQNQTSTTNEPSTGMNCETVFYTGNWYATVSSDGGRNFSYINPFTTFPAYSGGFCCDQVVYFEKSRGIMCWYLQYRGDATGNTVVLAISTSNSNTANNVWQWYVITPQLLGYDNGVEFDFPDLSASANNLYITTNFSGGPDDAIVFRLDLDDLANAAPLTLFNFATSLPNLRATHGAGATMYVGTQVDNNTLRIYSWPEADPSPSSVDRDVDAWFTGSSAPSPDGTDWVARDFNDILASWVGGGLVGFMWGSAQGGGFPWPNVRFARFNEADLALSDQGQIWNDDYAWAYPAVHPNENGDVGGTIALGGGGNSIPYPGFAAWIADKFNSGTIQPLENAGIAFGNAGPSNDRWGDYFTSRMNNPFLQTWNATGFILNDGQTGGFTEPYFVWFGREEDTPPPPSIICPEDITVECSSPGGTPAGDPQLEPFFDGVSSTDTCDPSVTITNDAPSFFDLGPTDVTFTATNDIGFSNTCTATVNVVDTTPPTISVTLSRYVLWPPNHRMVTISAEVEVDDICDPNPTFVLTSITSDEPDNGLGDGDRPDDIQGEEIGTPDTDFQLRSERQGTGDDREYTIVYTVMDESGNSATDTDVVTVPHDMGGFARGSTGYNPDGTAFEAGATAYTIVILSTPDLDATLIDGLQTLVGHHMGVIQPNQHVLADADGDQLMDLSVSYEVAATEELAATQDDEGTYPVGLRYVTADGQGYWVPDIFQLGPPIEEPTTGVPASAAAAGAVWGVQPNPFAGVTSITYAVEAANGGQVEIGIFNVAGQQVRTLLSGLQAPGQYEAVWDGKNDSGAKVPAGVYFCQVAVGDRHVVQRIVLMR